jgi:hypothetical protein
MQLHHCWVMPCVCAKGATADLCHLPIKQRSVAPHNNVRFVLFVLILLQTKGNERIEVNIKPWRPSWSTKSESEARMVLE